MDAHRATAEGDHMNDQAPPTADRADRAVTIRSLVKRYGELIAVDGLSLEIGRGEVLGLLGPNGSGKTTTINCLLQLLTYDKGEIRVFGRPMSATAYDLKRRIGVVPQEVAVFDELTVAENIDAFCALYVGDRARRRRRRCPRRRGAGCGGCLRRIVGVFRVFCIFRVSCVFVCVARAARSSVRVVGCGSERGPSVARIYAVREEPGAVDGSLRSKALMTNVTFL